MARVVVVGGGLGGIASAARLAKLGHDVTLLERSHALGGAMSTIAADGHTWDAGPTTTLLPGVLRDLFRKTGRPLERELDLRPQPVLREHRFVDGTSLVLPGGSRGAQHDAFERLGPGLGDAWCDHVASFADDWDVVRRHYLERPWDPGTVDRTVTDRLFGRETLHRRLKKAFRDDRLREVAAHPFVLEGHELRNVPAWLGVWAYVEQRFGAWTVPGGMARITEVLGTRLGTRGVTVLTGTAARDVVVRGGRAVAVATDQGPLDADVVVCAIDPRRLPALAPHVVRTMPAVPPVTSHVGLSGDVPDLPPEVVVHDEVHLVLRPHAGTAPDGGAAWTVLARGRIAEDVLTALARHGIDVRDQVVARVDRSPREQVEAAGGSSPMGVLWQGRATLKRRLGPTTPVPGVYAAGAHAAPGAGVPFVGLSAALVAQEVGPAPRG